MVENSSQETKIVMYPKDWDVLPLNKLVLNHNSGVFKNKKWYGKGVNIIGVSELYEHSKIDGQIFQLVKLTKEEKHNHKSLLKLLYHLVEIMLLILKLYSHHPLINYLSLLRRHLS